MQLKLALSVPKFTGSGFNQTTSTILTGVTIAGAFSTVIFNSTTARSKVNDAFKTFANLLAKTPIYSGAEKLATTFKSWGTTLVAKKDDFKQWVIDYLNPEGFKSGAVALYNKLYDWAEIVYRWFRDKFWPFIKNIPKMVENWKQLRLSLFKWGTFLGGGGGSALWAMFGSGDNWGKFAELMGDPKFAETLGTLSELMSENSDTFASMSQEDVETIMEKILEDHEEANEIAKDLLEKQREKNKDKEEKDKEQIDAKEMSEAFSKQKSGKPKDNQQALGDMIFSGLKKILNEKKTFAEDPYQLSKVAMKQHIEYLKKESNGKSEFAKVKKEFLENIKGSEDLLVNTFAGLSSKAYEAYQRHSGKKEDSRSNEKLLATIFENFMKEAFTEESNEEQGNAQIEGMVTGSVNNKK